jgi:hypothetical protein
LGIKRDIPRVKLIKIQNFAHHHNFGQILQVVADPFALALISPPLALSTKTESLLAL